MLISKVSEEAGDGEVRDEGNAPEYQTATELFDLMTKNSHFEAKDDDSLSTGDLVLLYKNIDIGTKLMNDATGAQEKKPNQYFETVVYNDDHDSETDLSEITSAEDIHNVFSVNQERLDFFNDKSLQNLLCHKLGGLEIQSSNLSTDYDRNFFFKDPYIKDQLRKLNVVPSTSDFDNTFSTSLIDYICCKRLEDNYNFYMDNIIRYVQVTIEQLKRISNGDYLTDRAKEKWREVNTDQQENDTKVLATSTSIPMHVQCKRNENATWDDIVHSAVDVRSLSKILEKKIVVEIPKLICGSYRLYSKHCHENLIISCQKDQKKVEHSKESRVDVVLQLQRSQTGQVMSNISSIMILRTASASQDLRPKEILPVPYKEECIAIPESEHKLIEQAAAIIELKNLTETVITEIDADTKELEDEEDTKYQDSQNDHSLEGTIDYPISEFDRNASCDLISNDYSSESSAAVGDILDKHVFPKCTDESPYNIISPDELRMAVHRLNLQSSALDEIGEESGTQKSSPRRRSPIRVRIKSPYENKSFLLEEKKRKRLLEIRERREKRKIALSENCKISKHKYGKGAIMPQASSSVTKLSITNKSFYNSIYGHSIVENNKSKPEKARKSQKTITIPPPPDVTPLAQSAEECYEPDVQLKAHEKNSCKYINRSFYLDDAETEMMYLQMKQNNNNGILDMLSPCSASNSVVSNEFEDNINLLAHFAKPLNTNDKSGNDLMANKPPSILDSASTEGSLMNLPIADCVANPEPINAKNDAQLTAKKSSTSTDECRKSIDQLYDLMKKFGKPNGLADIKTSKSKMRTNVDVNDETVAGSTIQGSDSGTSVKHHITSSNLSCYSCEKNDLPLPKLNKNQTPALQKVVISPKSQSPKAEGGKTLAMDRRKGTRSPPVKTFQDNPLKAISQLLHEFETANKGKPRPAAEQRPPKKAEAMSNDVRIKSRPGSYRRSSRLDQHLKENPEKKTISPPHTTNSPREKTISAPHTTNSPRDKRARPVPPQELARIPHSPIPTDDRLDKTKKKLADIIDEAKEARGEAVRGPSKPNSRLNSLAQPKRSYVQAHQEECQNRYGRNVAASRPRAPGPESAARTAPARARGRRPGVTSPPALPPSTSHIDRGPKPVKMRRSNSNSPNNQYESYRHIVPVSPDTLNKKMVAVESYLKSHYGSSSPSSDPNRRARIPVVPHDFELASPLSASPGNEARELGDKLHRMINSMVSSATSLSALAEGPEGAPPASPQASPPASPQASPPASPPATPRASDSDFRPAALEDSLPTAVEREAAEEAAPPAAAELRRLEAALYSQISGSFQKRLRIKTLTLTPKHSAQRLFLVQAGDAGSVVLRPREPAPVPVLAGGRLDWNFGGLPVQIATVGYAFPEYAPAAASLAASRINFGDTVTSDKFGQYFGGARRATDAGAQVVAAELAGEPPPAGARALAAPRPPAELEAAVSGETFPPPGLETVEEVQYPAGLDPSIDEVRTLMVKDDGTKLPGEPAKTGETDQKSVEYTSSLDVLVGLLTEIQKITCRPPDEGRHFSDFTRFLDGAGASATPDRMMSRDLVSITSLDNLRQLESDPSIFSFYVSNDSGVVGNNGETEPSDFTEVIDRSTDMPLHISASFFGDVDEKLPKPFCVDKEVSANTFLKEYVDNVTDVPSSLVPLAVDQSASVFGNSLTTALSSVSSQSIVCCADFQALYASPVFKTSCVKKIIELPQIRIERPHDQISRVKSDLNETCFKTTSPSTHIIKNVKKDISLVARSELRKYCVKNIDLDPMLKIKRDILVTMYSLLVLTIFAALSFPELIVFQPLL